MSRSLGRYLMILSVVIFLLILVGSACQALPNNPSNSVVNSDRPATTTQPQSSGGGFFEGFLWVSFLNSRPNQPDIVIIQQPQQQQQQTKPDVKAPAPVVQPKPQQQQQTKPDVKAPPAPPKPAQNSGGAFSNGDKGGSNQNNGGAFSNGSKGGSNSKPAAPPKAPPAPKPSGCKK